MYNKNFICAVAFFMAANCHITFAQTANVVINNTVSNAAPAAFGLNWAENMAGRNQNALNNQIGDSNFGEQIVRIKGAATSGTTTYLQNNSGTMLDYYETLYTGMFDGGNVRIYRETPTALLKIHETTVTTFVTSTGAVADQQKITFATPSPTPIQANDIYILTKVVANDLNQYAHPRLTWIRDGQNTWNKTCDEWTTGADCNAITKTLDANDKPANGGTASCKITNTDPDNKQCGIGQYFSDAAGEGYFSFDPTKTYIFSVWLKQTGIAGGRVNLRSTTTNINHNFTATNTWQQYTYSVTGINPIPTGAPVDFLNLNFDGVGTLWVDNFILYDALLAPYAMRPYVLQEFANFKPHTLRIWSGQTNTDLGTTLDNWTNPESQGARSWSVNNGPGTGNALTLPTILPICEANNTRPWLIVSPSFSEAEWLGLIEYLAAPANTPYGAKRAAQGHPAAYTSTLPKIYLELGNETWNPTFAPWVFDFNGERMGKFAQYFYNVVKSSPYFDPAKFELMLGGWSLQTDQYGYGQAGRRMSPDGAHVGLANYIGGWDANIMPATTSFTDSLQYSAMFARWLVRPLIDRQVAGRNAMATAGFPYKLAIYEAGPGYALPNPQFPYDLYAERIGKSLACAVANLDAFLYQSQNGFEVQNLFLFAPGYNWSSHTSYDNGYRPHNHFLALQMRNRYVTGEMISNNVANSLTTPLPWGDANFSGSIDTDPADGDAPAGNYENIGAYSFKDGGKYSTFVMNRSVTQAQSTTVQLPNGLVPNNVQLYKLEGAPGGSNTPANNYSIVNQNITTTFTTNSYTFNAQPGGIYLFVMNTGAPLGVDLVEFEVNCLRNELQVSWATSTEKNVKTFEIQQSIDAQEWTLLHTQAPKNATNGAQYLCKATPNKTSRYFRLKTIDFDGSTQYSKIVSEACDFTNNDVVIYPNPAQNQFVVRSGNQNIERIEIYNSLGAIVKTILANEQMITVFINDLPTGVYTIKTTITESEIINKLIKTQ